MTGAESTPASRPPAGVALAIVDGGEWSAAFGLSLTELQLWDVAHDARVIRPGCGYLHHQAGTGAIAEARNQVAARFLADTTAEWLFMVDTDMGFAPDTLDRMLASADPDACPVVGALTFQQRYDRMVPADLHAKRWRIQPAMYQLARIVEDGAAGTRGEEGFVSIRDYPRDSLVEVDATGAACLLVHRRVFGAVADRFGPGSWFEPLRHPTGAPGGTPRWFSEDMSFCLRVAAVDATIHVDTSVKTTHHKGGLFLDETTYDLQEAAKQPAPSGLAVDQHVVDTLYPESHWTARRDDCPYPGFWHATDAQSTEVEVSELVAAFVRALQPELVIETGSCIGQTSAAIGRALAANGHGRLVTLEPVAEFARIAERRCEGLPVEIACAKSLDFLAGAEPEPAAFIWLDSLTELRIPELRELRKRRWLADRAVVGVHDTGPQHNPLGDQLRALSWIRYLDLPTPRGVVFLQVIDDD